MCVANTHFVPCFKDKSKDLLQMPQTQSYPRLLSQVQAEAHAQVEGLYDPTRCEALAKCDAFAKKVFEFVCVRVAAMLVARPGGHPMKPLKLDMAPHLPKRKRWEVGVGKGPGGRTMVNFLSALPCDPDFLWTGHRWHATKWTVKCANCQQSVKFRQSWKEVTPIVLAPCPGVSRKLCQPPEEPAVKGHDTGNWLSKSLQT